MVQWGEVRWREVCCIVRWYSIAWWNAVKSIVVKSGTGWCSVMTAGKCTLRWNCIYVMWSAAASEQVRAASYSTSSYVVISDQIAFWCLTERIDMICTWRRTDVNAVTLLHLWRCPSHRTQRSRFPPLHNCSGRTRCTRHPQQHRVLWREVR